ncbi:hypothetical protein L7F22_026712 [Adiantum nelumboides]|nr:hypothetical protein [Adiantum nelumboides]
MEELQQATSESNKASKSPSPKNPSSGGSRSGGVNVPADGSPAPSSPQIVVNSKESVQLAPEQSLASIRSSPAPSVRGDVWGVLTAISDKAKARPQGSQVLLYNSEHVLGRTVKDPSCQFDSINVSAKHCTIFRKKFKADERNVHVTGTEPVSTDRWLVYIKDSSSNGTFINCQRLKRDSPEARIKDGDIISLVNAPEHENAFAFLYEEVKPNGSVHQSNGSALGALKRKFLHDGEVPVESNIGDSKRVKVLGIGGPDGPVSLDDVRRLQRSNEDLRNQLEAHLLTIEKLRAESRAATARHDAEIKELRETLSAAFLDQIQDLRSELGKKEKELEISSCLCAQQQSQLEDRNRSLVAAIHSRKDADEVIKSQKVNIDELKAQLEDERSQRRSERERAEADLRSAVERVRSEATEELKRQSDFAAQQLKEHLEMINKLQETDKENRVLIETLRSKLDDAREALVKAERTSRTLVLRLQDEESCSALAKKKIAEKEQELQCANNSLEEEKAAKEKALACLSAMEIEMEAATRDLQMEQQRLQGARERIVLRETQLRAFHSTAEEIATLQQKQQVQLQEMMRVLEDGEEESQDPAINQSSGQGGGRSRGEENTQRGDDDDAMQVTGQSMGNETVNNEEQGEDAGDADSQTTPSSIGIKDRAVLAGGDTQMDEDCGLENASREAQLVLPAEEEHKGSEPSVPKGADAAGHTQMIEIETNCGRYNNETQELDNGRDEGNKAVAVFTQLVDTQSRSYSMRYLNDTQILTNPRDENLLAGPQEASGNTDSQVVEEHNGGQGGESLLIEDEEDVADRDWGRKGSAQFESQAKESSVGANDKSKQDGHSALAKACEPVTANDIAKGKTGPTTTAELLTSEVAGSWAYNTPASVHCDNGGWSQSQARGEAPQNEAQQDYDASQVGGQGMRRMQRGSLVNREGPLAAWHQKERRDLNVMLGIVAPELSRLHGLDRVMETAPDSEEHTEEEEDAEDGHDSDDSGGDLEPVSQSVSVSARY